MTELNLQNWWMPFSNVRAFQEKPRIFTRAEGCFLYNEEDQAILDITGRG